MTERTAPTVLRAQAVALQKRIFAAPTSDWTKARVRAYVDRFLELLADRSEADSWTVEHAPSWVAGLEAVAKACAAGTAYVALLDVTFDVVTPESATDGDFAETGFHRQNLVCEGETLRELVDELVRTVENEVGCVDCHRPDDTRWYGADGVPDYHAGSETRYAAHLSLGDDDREFVAMVNAAIAA